MTTPAVPANKVSRSSKKPTNAELLAELEALKAEKAAAETNDEAVAAEAARKAHEEEIANPFSFSMEPVNDHTTLVNHDPKTGKEIHVRRLSVGDSKKLTELRHRAYLLQKRIADDRTSDEDSLAAMREADELQELMGSICFDEETDTYAKTAGIFMYKKFVERGMNLIANVAKTQASTGN